MSDDEKMFSSEQRNTLLLIVGVVIAAVATPVFLMPDSASAPDAESVSTATPSKGTVQTYEATPATGGEERSFDESSLRPVPDSHIGDMSNDRGDGPPEPSGVSTSAGSQTMEIETTVVNGEPALVLADDRTHEGRWVSVETSWLQEVHGEVPSTVTIEHESGTVYTEKVRVRGESAAFYVREFSSNTVTFSGEVSISADPADDGSQYSYEINDLDAASDVTVNMTGVTNTETETRSWSGVASGGSKTVDVAGNQAPTEQSVTFVGEESTSAQSRSGTGVSTGSTTIDVGGDGAPRNAEITFTGTTTTSGVTVSASGLSSDGSDSFAVGGNIDPQNGELTVTGYGSATTYNPMDAHGDGAQDNGGNFYGDDGNNEPFSSDVQIQPTKSGALTKASVYISTVQATFDSAYQPSIDVYLIQGEGADATAAEGTLVASGWKPSNPVSEGWKTVTFADPVTVTAGETYTLGFVTTNSNNDGGYDYAKLGYDDSASTNWLHIGGSLRQVYGNVDVTVDKSPKDVTATLSSGKTVTLGDFSDGQTKTKNIDVSLSDSSIDFASNGFGTVDYSLSIDERTATENPAVDVDGDGTAEASHSGILTSGQTATGSVSGLSTGSNTLDWSRTAGSYDWSLSYDRVDHTTDPSVDVDGDGTAEASVSGTLAPGETATQSVSGLSLGSNTLDVSTTSVTTGLEVGWTETTQTVDAGVELNGETVSVAGTLSDGESVQRTINKSAIQEGTNVVNVSVGDGTLSADAPAPQVQFELSHDAADRQSVQYAAEQWTSRYNVSKSYASSRANATLTIPFDSSDVVSMRAVEVRFNGTSWSSMSSTNYALNGTELTADLSAAYGGDIPAGTTVEVRANASKIQPINGSLTIVEATDVGQPLNTKIEVNSAGAGFRIETASNEIHYAHNASYENGEYWVADQQGQRLHLPDARSGDTLRVSTLPVIADPVAGDVHVTVANTSATEPAVAIKPGQSGGNAVDYTFVDALDGKTYSLWSTTYQIVRDQGTASSPLTLTDDDSQEKLKWLLANNSTSTGGSGGSTGGGLPMGQPEGTDWLPLIAVALALGGLVVASRNSDAVTNAGNDTASGVEGALDGIPVVGPLLGRTLSGAIQGVAQLARAAVENRTIAASLGAAIFWGAVQGGIIALPAGSSLIILVAGVAVLSAIGLYETGQFDIRVWAGIVVATAATAAIVTSDADPIAAITNSGLFPLIAIGGAYLVYQALKAARTAASTPNETTEVVIETDGGEK